MDEPATDVREPTDGTPGTESPADVASLVSELRAAKAELEARNEALRLVNDLTFRLQRRLDPEGIAAETAEALRGGSAPPLVAIYLLDGPDGPLRLVAGRGFTDEELALGARLPLEGSASGRAVRERRIVSLGEVRIEGRDVHPVMDALARRHVASGLCIPLAHGGRPLGTVNVIFPEGRPLRPEEAETFEGVARAVSLAVANAGHRNELEERAFRDALTGLPNRAGLHRRFGALVDTVGGGRAALVLLDDAFESIVKAVRTGRRIFDNLRKAMLYIFAVHVPIAGLSLFPVLLGWPLALLPVHIVFLELIIDPACTVVFEAEEGEEGVMRRPPRPLDEPIFGGRGLLLGLVQGLSELAVDLALYGWALAAHGEPVARALAFTTMVLGNVGLIFLNRAGSRSLLETLRAPNRPERWVTGGAFAFLALALGVPGARELFGFATPHPELLALSAAGALVSLTVANLARHLLAERTATGR